MSEAEHPAYNPTGEGLALTHGAGGDYRSPLLVAIAEAFAQSGVYVLRFNLSPGRSAPKDRAIIREAIAKVRNKATGAVYCGGQSYGGRQTSMVVAEEPAAADALLLFSYPLHPPGKPTELRTAHFPQIRNPTLFVHGPRDPFATTAELEAAANLIPAPKRIHEIPKAAHDLLKGRFDHAAVLAALQDILHSSATKNE